MVWMFAYFLAETCYTTFFMSYEPKMKTVYMHHLISSIAILPGLYFGGWTFSQNFIVTLCEMTNPCNNLRGLLLDIERPGNLIYEVNAVVWFFFFFWFRTVLFSYLVFTKMMFCMDGFECPDYQSMLEGYDVLLMRFYQLLSWAFWGLNMVWTWEIFKAVMRMLGYLPKKKKSE